MRRTQVLFLDQNKQHLSDVYNLVTGWGHPILVCQGSKTLRDKLGRNKLGSNTRNLTIDLFMFGELDFLLNDTGWPDYGVRRADYLSSILPLFPLRPFVVNVANEEIPTVQLVRLYEAGVDCHARKGLDKNWIADWLRHEAQPNYVLPEVPR